MNSCPMLLTETVNMCGVRAVSRLRGIISFQTTFSNLLFSGFCFIIYPFCTFYGF